MQANQFQYSPEFAKEELAEKSQQPSLEAQAHPVLWGGKFALISGGKPEHAPQAPAGSIGQELKQKGIQHEPTEGHYGKVESSWILHNPSREQAMELGRRHGQEAIVYSDGGQHELIYVNGPHAGKYHPSVQPQLQYFRTRPKDNYTMVPGHGFVRLHFDFNKLLDVPKKLMAIPEGKSDMDSKTEKNMVSVTDLKKSLAELIKRQITAYQANLVELRDRELKKGEGELVAGMDNTAGDFSFGVCPLCNDESCECVQLAKSSPYYSGLDASECDNPSCGENLPPGHKGPCPHCGYDVAKGKKSKKVKKGEKCAECGKENCECAAEKEFFGGKKEENKGSGRQARLPSFGKPFGKFENENCLLCGQPQFNCSCSSKLQKTFESGGVPVDTVPLAQNEKIDSRQKIGSQTVTQQKKVNAAEDRFKAKHGVPATQIQADQAKRGEIKAKRVKKGEAFIDLKHANETVKEGQSKAGEPRLKEAIPHPGIVPGDAPTKDVGGLDDGSGGEPAGKGDVTGTKGKGLKKEAMGMAAPPKAPIAKPPSKAKLTSAPKAGASTKIKKEELEKAGQKAIHLLESRVPPPPAAMGLKLGPKAGPVAPPKVAAPPAARNVGGKAPLPMAGLNNVTNVGAKKPGIFGKVFGKSEDFGQCALCGQSEHAGNCE